MYSIVSAIAWEMNENYGEKIPWKVTKRIRNLERRIFEKLTLLNFKGSRFSTYNSLLIFCAREGA